MTAYSKARTDRVSELHKRTGTKPVVGRTKTKKGKVGSKSGADEIERLSRTGK